MPAELTAGRDAVRTTSGEEARAAGWLVGPALALVALVAGVPVLWAFVESLHLHDLRAPWLGRPFVAFDHYRDAFSDPRFLAALGHTLFFTFVTVLLELTLGLALALALHARLPGRGLARTAALLPWALPTVVAALVWRFLFDGPSSLANQAWLARSRSPGSRIRSSPGCRSSWLTCGRRHPS
jgi:ABC-type sugar transport system permease subunit